MAVSKKAGKDNSGDYVYKKDASGNYVYDAKGRKVLDHDLNEIAEAFVILTIAVKYIRKNSFILTNKTLFKMPSQKAFFVLYLL